MSKYIDIHIHAWSKCYFETSNWSGVLSIELQEILTRKMVWSRLIMFLNISSSWSESGGMRFFIFPVSKSAIFITSRSFFFASTTPCQGSKWITLEPNQSSNPFHQYKSIYIYCLKNIEAEWQGQDIPGRVKGHIVEPGWDCGITRIPPIQFPFQIFRFQILFKNHSLFPRHSANVISYSYNGFRQLELEKRRIRFRGKNL